MLSVDFNRNCPFFNYEEKTTRVSLLENILPLGTCKNNHLLDELRPLGL